MLSWWSFRYVAYVTYISLISNSNIEFFWHSQCYFKGAVEEEVQVQVHWVEVDFVEADVVEVVDKSNVENLAILPGSFINIVVIIIWAFTGHNP
jgi:hypothetical protein